MTLTLTQLLTLLVQQVQGAGLNPNPHLLAPASVSTPGLGNTFCLDMQSDNPGEQRQKITQPMRHTLTVTYWVALPTKGSTDMSVWGRSLDIEQEVIRAIQTREMWWRSSYRGTKRTVNPSGELIRTDVSFTLISEIEINPASGG